MADISIDLRNQDEERVVPLTLPSLCPTCWGCDHALQFIKEDIDKKCRLCDWKFKTVKWSPTPDDTRQIEICISCSSKLGNICQLCGEICPPKIEKKITFSGPPSIPGEPIRKTVIPCGREVPMTDDTRQIEICISCSSKLGNICELCGEICPPKIEKKITFSGPPSIPGEPIRKTVIPCGREVVRMTVSRRNSCSTPAAAPPPAASSAIVPNSVYTPVYKTVVYKMVSKHFQYPY